MRKKIIAANWKMHGSFAWIKAYFETLHQEVEASDAELIFFPPYPFLSACQQNIVDGMSLGAQNSSPHTEGAYTGEVSCAMLKECGCHYVLVGHSERRLQFSESEKIIAEKFHRVREHDMIPVLCVGETLSEREEGVAERVITRQLEAVAHINRQGFERCVIAYEPVWAIGTGITASPEQAQDMHATIRKVLHENIAINATNISVLYGGSVNEKNAKELFSMPDVDGGLVGGASLDAKKFATIHRAI